MMWLKTFWRDLVECFKWSLSVDNEPFIKDIREAFDQADRYERLEKHYPDEIAQMNTALDEKERNVHES